MRDFKQNLNNWISNIKTMTSETYPLMPIPVNFDLSFTPSQLFYDNLVANDGDSSFDRTKSYLEITVADNSIYSTITIMNKIVSIIEDAFQPLHCKLG